MKSYSLILFCLMAITLNAQPQNEDFQALTNSFETEYQQLNIPFLQLSYESNLRAIPSKKALAQQTEFFKEFKDLLQNTEVNSLSEQEQITHVLLNYEIQLNLERLSLENQWKSKNYKANGKGLYNEPMGKEWYAYYLKKWVDKDITPDWAYEFGLEEIEKVKKRMNSIRQQMGMDEVTFQKHVSDSTYFLTNNEDIKANYDALRIKVRERAKDYFPDIEKISSVYIEAGTNEEMAIAPAYYNNNTFYYNFFDKPYDKRDMGWIFLHEGIPGHHYQNRINAAQNRPLQDLFWYSGNAEGWAAYIEQYGRQLGAYTQPMDVYSQLHWDLIRSVRVTLDVALNYYGWTDEQAMNFWNQHLPNEEDIGLREINRMKRWPAQVITYKYGKYILDELKGDKKSAEELKEFHTQVMEFGSIPLSILKELIDD